MRSTAIWVLRHLIVPVGLVWATGIFSVVRTASSEATTASLPYQTFDASDYSTLEMTPHNIVAYGDSLYKARVLEIKETGVYRPLDYFHDLKQYKMFEARYKDTLDRTTEGRLLYMRCLSCVGSSTFGSLVNLRDRNWSTRGNNAGFEEARKHWFPQEALREAEAAKTPIVWTEDVWRPLLGWLLRFYLRGLPFAFLMLLFWRIGLKKEERCSALLPGSFLVSLGAWPIVLALDIRNRMRSVLARAEVMARRESMLSLVSNEERSLFEFGKRMSRKEFKSYLVSIGHTRKRSLAWALAGMLLFTAIVPGRAAFAATYAPAAKETECIRMVHVSFHCAGVAHSPPRHMVWDACTSTAAEAVFERKAQEIFHVPTTVGRILTGFLLAARGVPKGTIRFSRIRSFTF